MARIPTFADVGFKDPNVTTPIPTYPQSDPVTTAEGEFGQGLQQAGAAALHVANAVEDRRQALNVANATVDMTSRLIDLHTQAQTETDPTKLAGLREQFATILPTSANAIDDPQRKALFVAQHSPSVLQAQFDVDKRLAVLGKASYAANTERDVDAMAGKAAAAGDPNAVEAALIAGKQKIDATAAAIGNPEWGYTRGKRFANELFTSGVGKLIEQGKADQATALLDAHPLDIDPIHADVLRRRIAAKGIGIAGDSVAASALGVGAGPADIPTGGPGTGEGHVAPQAERIAFSRQYAASKGINPDAVAATIGGEGLGKYTGDGGTSFGDFQLHVGGGMGDLAQSAGINIRDPNTWREQAKFAIDQMAANRDKGPAWYAGQWHGAPGWAAASFARPGGGEAATNAAPDQMVGQPQPGQTPPVNPAPGMESLAAAEAELAQRHAKAVLAVESDPRSADPSVMAHAIQKIDIDFRARQMAITAQKQAITEARSAAQDGYVQQMMKGPIDPSILQNIGADQRLDATSRENLWRVYEAHTKGTTDGDAAKYGPKFFQYYQRITAPDDDPNKIRDPSQILSLAVPKDDGSQDLTLAGVDKLRQELSASRSPERVGDQKRIEGALAYAKHQLSFEQDYGYFKIPDPKGADAFNVGFIPSFFSYYEKGLAAGKRPDELLSQDSIDKLIGPLKRSPEALARDRLSAGTEAGTAAAKPTAPGSPPESAINYLKTHPELRGAFEQKYKVPATQFLTPLDTGPQAPLR